MTPLHHALAAVALALATICSITCFALNEATSTIQSQIQNWQAGIEGDRELIKSRLMQRLYDNISAQGLEDMKGIPDPENLAPGERWELVYKSKETQILAGKVYTQGTLQSFANTHPLLFTMIFLNMTPDLIATEIRIKTNANRVYCMDDASQLIASEMSEKLYGQIWKVVLAARTILIAVFFCWLCVPLALVAIFAFRDIKVHTLKSD